MLLESWLIAWWILFLGLAWWPCCCEDECPHCTSAEGGTPGTITLTVRGVTNTAECSDCDANINGTHALDYNGTYVDALGTTSCRWQKTWTVCSHTWRLSVDLVGPTDPSWEPVLAYYDTSTSAWVNLADYTGYADVFDPCTGTAQLTPDVIYPDGLCGFTSSPYPDWTVNP